MRTNAAGLFLAGFMVAVGAGCTTSPPATPGGQMISQSKDTRDLGRQWQQGQQAVVRGEQLKTEGQQMIARGEQTVREGENLIIEGKAAMAESERIFQERFPGQTLQGATPPSP
jgi:hypothetical protein